jgi:hypothetical protein
MALCPDNGWLHYNMGLLQVAQGHAAQAKAAFERALACTNPKLTPRKEQKARPYIASVGV